MKSLTARRGAFLFLLTGLLARAAVGEWEKTSGPAGAAGQVGAEIHRVAVSPQNRTLALAAGRSGPFLTPNGGADWFAVTAAGFAPAGNEWHGAAIHPANPLVMYLSDENLGRIFRSGDAGASWRQVYAQAGVDGTTGKAHGAKELIVIDASETVYAGFAQSGLFTDPARAIVPGHGVLKSTDGGATWNAKNNGLGGTSLDIVALVVAPTNNAVLFAGVRGAGIFKTIDGGEAWTNITGAIGGDGGMFALAVSPTDADTVFAGTQGGGLYKSTNGGVTWTRVIDAANPAPGAGARSFFALAINPRNANDVWAADWSAGVWRSTDGGTTWAAVNTGLANRVVTSLAFSGDGLFLYAGTKGDGVFRLQTVALPPVSTAGRITNLAIRSTAGTEAQTLIVGVTVGGSGTGGAKPLLVRGVGPALTLFGVPGALVDPKLEFYTGRGAKLIENDNWVGDAQVTAIGGQVGAFPLGAATGKDAAFASAAILPGSYTAQISGVGGATGVALAEIYDATPAENFTSDTPRLVNVSARTQVGTGGNILIAGFTVGGGGSKKVLIRAVGPRLADFSVAGVLADPQLELFAGTTRIDGNNDWGSGGGTTLAAAFTSVGAFTLTAGSKDAAILVTLPPGSYSAQVSGVGGTTGVGLVEVYEVP